MKPKKLKLLKEIKELMEARDNILEHVWPPEANILITRNDYNLGQEEIILTLIAAVFKEEEEEALVFLGMMPAE
jgi:hypothetical protein